ncbi:uncharacterized protein [Maniola hyperantus]|uniref:uncharacterized protein n=1 Tax=Aphantopus hyperantus TaxID=2795564 RepID=UPI001569359A|nr:uncharacterized protein LOC117992703 [Maniola hyperantus]
MSHVETRSKKAKKDSSEEESTQTNSTDVTGNTKSTEDSDRTASTDQTENTEETITMEKKQSRRKAGSRTSVSRRAELQASIQAQEKRLEAAKIEAELAQKRLELAQLADSSDQEEDPEQIERVNNWVNKNPTTPRENDAGIENLMKAFQQHKIEVAPRKPPTYMSDLPYFDGDPINWIPFSKHFTSTASHFMDIENIARIRRALKGQAKEAVKSLLYTSSTPDNILKELERRFGQPTYIIKGLLAELHKLPKMTEDLRGIGAFASAVFNAVDTIKQLDRTEYLYATEIADKIIDKMNTLVRFRWQEFRADRKREPTLSLLSEFLTKMSNDFDEPGPSYSRSKPENNKRPFRKAKVNVVQIESESEQSDDDYDSEFEEEMKIVLAACAIDEEKCLLCEQAHDITKCNSFLREPVKDRWETVKRLKMCFRCLKTNHRHLSCKVKQCAKEGCSRKHHELLHQERKLETNKIVSVNHIGTSRAFLKIVPVELHGPKGSTRVTALLDEGSTVTLLLEEVASQIGATGPKGSLQIEGISGHQIRTEQSSQCKLRIRGLCSRNYENLQAHTINQLNLRPQSVTKKDIEDCPHLRDIEDQLIYDGSPPTLLIGQDNWHLIVTRDLKAGDPTKPVASLTSLGWILHGLKTETPKPVLFTNHTFEKKTEDIDELIKSHFSLDSLGITPKKPTNDPEERALAILEKTTRRLPEGRFECGLLWKTDNESMPLNRRSALRRLNGIENKFKKNPEFKIDYSKQITNLLANGYAEPAATTPTSPRTWYLPHFAVIHPQKGKLRVVFDAAEKTNGKSLNDALLAGPDLLQSLFGVLLRFRQGPTAVAADIKEMFLRIIIREEDRDSLRFLWRETESEEPKEYRMKSLIFGATSSPCSAIYVKNRNAEDFKSKHPKAVNAIQRCHYMDDYLQSFATPEEALETSREVDKIHKSGGFELRGWTSNHPDAIKDLETDQPEHKHIGDHDKYGKTLGMIWQINNDALKFTLNLRNTPEDVIHGLRPPTKREVASAVMSVFDPLGLATPVLIQGKTLIQHLWRTGISWDDPIPEDMIKPWTKWVNTLECLEDLNIPRCTHSQDEGELHTFVDASENVYAAATYWRTIEQGKVVVKLIAAKAKVAPLKPTSIPRLELQAALLGCRLASSIQNEMDNSVKRRYFWSDSRTVLAWIKSDPRTFKTFVAHRLAEIEDLTKTNEWRYVPTKHNVADDATRNPPKDFNVDHRWFNGPEFLKYDSEEWPQDKSDRSLLPTGEEKVQTVATIHHNEMPILDVKRFSSWTRYLRATARFLQSVDRFKALTKKTESTAATKRITKDKSWKPHKDKTKRQNPPTNQTQNKPATPHRIKLTHDYIEKAENLIIRAIQNESFKTELKTLQENKRLNKTSRLGRLTTVIENDILHLQTRLSAAKDIAISYKKPIILDGKHPIARLIVKHYHQQYNHGNHYTVMNEIRQKFYVTSLRNTVKLIARECQWCKTHKAIPAAAPVGDLPIERLKQKQHPFTCTAVDYFGPITITIGRKTDKRWVALYTCLTTRAVHLEIATSLSTDNMILTLRRMIARRGTPRVIYSDNGTNFIGADKELRYEFNKMIEKTEEKGIQWKFIPPGAPHMGGAWERLVRSVKTALTATLNTRHPKEEILHTLLLEAEHLINSRPITDLSLDPDEQESLTPNHFLIGRSSGSHRMGDFTDSELVGLTTWKTVQRLTDHFWKRWLLEYLPTITPKYNNGKGGFINPSIGDIVIIIDNSLPRGTWPKGEIVKTYPGPDGVIRIVDVRTVAGILKRSTSRLVKITQSSSANNGAPDSIFARGGDC